MSGDSLGDRMKGYENISRISLTRRLPVMIRVDGKAFHTYTKWARKPFDEDLIEVMKMAAKLTASEMQGFKVGYVQSDEASFLLTDFDKLETEAWFGSSLQKIVSITASMMASYFNNMMTHKNLSRFQGTGLAFFDARAWTLPKEEVSNYFLWRAKDWERNSLQMYARSVFSHKELHEKGREDMHEMLHMKGKNWATDVSDVARNGTFLFRADGEEYGVGELHDVLPNFPSINSLVEPYLSSQD